MRPLRSIRKDNTYSWKYCLMFLDIYKRHRKLKRQSRMDNPKKLARSGTQDGGEKYKSLPSHMSIAIPHFWLFPKNVVPTQLEFNFCCLTPLSAIFQLYHGNQFQWWKKPEYPKRTTGHGKATGKLRVECNIQNWARTHVVLVIGLYELLGNPTI